MEATQINENVPDFQGLSTEDTAQVLVYSSGNGYAQSMDTVQTFLGKNANFVYSNKDPQCLI